MSEPGLSYRDSGVDIDAANLAKGGIAALLRATRTADTLSDLGSFGGLYRVPRDVAQPVLVASADGVGTKLKVAFMTGRHDTVGEDLVNHCVNDILVQGARPLFFLDYVGMGRLRPETVEALVGGIARACRANGCALLGGETAELPDFYAPGEYDLAGTVVGIVEESRVLTGSEIRAGDVVVGIGSSGLHTNGYSLARKVIFERMGLAPDDRLPGADGTVADLLLAVHRSYLRSLLPLIDSGAVHALAHITGGGLLENIPRVLPPGLDVRIDRAGWEVPALFQVIQEAGGVEEAEMFRAFNMGIGMVAIVRPEAAAGVVRDLELANESAWVVGEVVPGDGIVQLN